jgi:hypothetical protein
MKYSKNKMRVFSVFFVVLLLFCNIVVSGSSSFASSFAREEQDVNVNALKLAIASDNTDAVEELAIQHLAVLKSDLAESSEQLGFSQQELSGLQIGNPFSIYVFGSNSQLFSSDTIVFPLLYADDIVGVMEVGYNNTTNEHNFTFGRSYADELNNLKSSFDVDISKDVVIARMERLFFATNGVSTVVLNDKIPINSSSTLTKSDIETVSADLISTVDAVYLEPFESISGEILSLTPIRLIQVNL